jgi:hypothetical protein
MVLASLCGAADAQTPADEFAQILAMLAPSGSTAVGWSDLDNVSRIRWDALPPTMLEESLPDGAMFTRNGTATIDGRRFSVIATGPRTTVTHVYFRTEGAPLGASAVVNALRRQDFTLELVRCPLTASPRARTNWWHLSRSNGSSNWLRSQTNCDGAECEAFALFFVAPPSMTPDERRLYTERCAPGMPSAEPAVAAWDEQLASLLASFIPPPGTLRVDWITLDKAGGLRWKPLPPQETRLPTRDTNHFIREGETDLGGRVLYLTATGSESSVLNVYVEDQRPQQNRGDMLRQLEQKGFRVDRVRCGKVYRLSTSDWYRVTRPDVHPVIVRVASRCETTACARAQESYALTLGGALPPPIPGEVDAVNGRCPGL